MPTTWSRVVDVDGVRLHVRETDGGGTAPDLLLVHGLASNAQLWAGLARLFAAVGHRVVAVDQRGHGLSSHPDDGYGFDRLTADLLGVVDAMGLDRPVAVGQSWGGNVVIELARRHPDRIRGVVAVDGGHIELSRAFDDWAAAREALTPPPLAGTPFADLEHGMRTRWPDWPEEGIQGQLANFVRRPDGTAAPHLSLARHLAILRHLWDHHPAERYAAVTAPVLLLPVRGQGWDTGPAVDRVAETLPRCRVRWLSGSHDIHAEDPAAVAAVVQEALADGFLDPDAHRD